MAFIQGVNIRLGADTSGLDKALGDINRRANKLGKELRQVDRLLKFDSKNTTLASQRMGVLSDAIKETETKLRALKAAQESVKDEYGEDSEQYRALQREIEATKIKVNQLKDAQKAAALKTAKAWEDAGRKIQNVGRRMDEIGQSLTRHVSLPLIAVGALAIKSAVDFESAFAGVRKTVSATEEEFAVLEQGIRDMAMEVPIAREEIAGIAEAAGQLGIKTENIMAFTRVIADLGVATNMTGEEAATTLARFANITQMPQDDFERLGSTIVDLGNNLATTEAEIADMALRIAGAGAAVGMTEAQILGVAGALSSVGLEAEAGGTAVSRTINEIDKAVALNGESLEIWAELAGTSVDKFSTAWKEDATGALEDVFIGLGKVKDEGGNLNVVFEELGIDAIRQADMIKRISGAGDLMTNSLNLANEAWDENNALTKEAQQRYETTASQLVILKNKVTDSAVTLGDALIPALIDAIDAIEPFLDTAADLARGFADLDEETQRTYLAWAGAVIAAGPMLRVLGAMTKLFNGLTTAGAKYAAWTTNAGGLIPALKGSTSWMGALVTKLGLGAGAVGGVTAAVVVGVPALAAYAAHQETAARKAGELAEANLTASEKAALLADRTGTVASLHQDLAPALDSARDATRNTTGAMGAYNDTLDRARNLLGQVKAAQDLLRESTVNIEQAKINSERADLRLIEAQKRLHELLSAGVTSGAEYEDAVLDVRQAALDAATAHDTLKTATGEFNTLSYDTSEKVRHLNLIEIAARKAGEAVGAIPAPGSWPKPHVPGYATGGIVDGAAFRMTGEDGPEAIIPLSSKYRREGSELLQQAAKMMGISAGGVTIAVDARGATDPYAIEAAARRGAAAGMSAAVRGGRLKASMMGA